MKECSKPYRNRTLRACCMHRTHIIVTKRHIRILRSELFQTNDKSTIMTLFSPLPDHKDTVHSTKIIVIICHVNMLRSELFQTNGHCTFMTLLPPAGRKGHKDKPLDDCKWLPKGTCSGSSLFSSTSALQVGDYRCCGHNNRYIHLRCVLPSSSINKCNPTVSLDEF